MSENHLLAVRSPLSPVVAEHDSGFISQEPPDDVLLVLRPGRVSTGEHKRDVTALSTWTYVTALSTRTYVVLGYI